MATSMRDSVTQSWLQRLLEETAAIDRLPTRHMEVAKPAPSVEQFFAVDGSPWLRVVHAVHLWMRNHPMPPLRLCLAPSVLNAYWLNADWQTLHLCTYCYHFPDGRMAVVELVPMETLPESIVYCSGKRAE